MFVSSVSAAGPIRLAGDLITAPLTARWEDIVLFAQAELATHEHRFDDAARGYDALVGTALAGGRLLHVNRGSCGFTDLLVAAGRTGDADKALRRAENAFGGTEDLASLSRLQVHRSRLLRLAGRHVDAAALLERARGGIDPVALTRERIVWLVESLVSNPGQAPVFLATVEEASARTGVSVPPWERRVMPCTQRSAANQPATSVAQ